MITKTCKKCKSAMIKTSLEARDTYWIHIHHVCIENESHPFYCEQEGRWVGK